MNMPQFIEHLVEIADLVALGGSHHGRHSQVYESLEAYFKKFSGIYMETPIDQQSSVESFLRTGNFDEKLEKTLQGALKEGKDLRGDWLLSRKISIENSLPVVCFDSSKVQTDEYKNVSPVGRYFLRGKSRDEDMFVNILNHFKNQSGKWLIIGGSQHIKYGIHFKSGDATLGSRLKGSIGDRFVNVCLWVLDNEEDKKILKDTMGCFDVRGKEIDPILAELLKRNNAGIADENGKLYFDTYVVHT